MLNAGKRLRGILVVAFTAVLAGGLVAAVLTWRTSADERVGARSVTIAVVGDSLTAGSNNQVVWPTLLAQRTGWSVANFALPGSGFAADGRGGYSFPRQVDRALALRPRVVLFFGGVDDGNYAFTGVIGTAVTDALNKVKNAGPRALVIGPTWYGTAVPKAITAVSDEIGQSSQKASVPFLNALNPPWLTIDQMQANLGGPNDAGQSAIADKVAAWLRTEVAPA
jgi:hypothetical protein